MNNIDKAKEIIDNNQNFSEMETNKQYYVGVRFDEKDGHPIICNGGKIFNSYDACRHDTVDNAKVMALMLQHIKVLLKQKRLQELNVVQ